LHDRAQRGGRRRPRSAAGRSWSGCQAQEHVPTTIEFVDIAGLVKGASQGEGLGNQFLSHIRSVDAIAHVVRCFEDDNVQHVEGKVDPASDVEVIDTELLLRDIQSVENRLDRARKQSKSGDKVEKKALAACERMLPRLMEAGTRPARSSSRRRAGGARLRCSPAHVQAGPVRRQRRRGRQLAAGLEEPAGVSGGPRTGRERGGGGRGDLGQHRGRDRGARARGARRVSRVHRPRRAGLHRLIRQAYELLDLITYFTAGEKECRAWTISRGTKAPQAAGKIHTDFERGFIKAEVMHWDQLVELGSEAAAKAKGLLGSRARSTSSATAT
jgi:ribosome-binding ATPase